MDLRHHRIEPVLALDELAQPTAGGGEPAQERRVDRLVDPEREHPRVTQPRRELVEQPIFVAHLTVGDEHDDALAILFAVGVATAEHVEGAHEWLGHLGAATCIDLRERLDRAEPFAIRREREPGCGNRFDSVVEREHAERVARGERIDHLTDRSSGGDHLPAFHAARAIDHKHDVTRLRGDRRRARGHEREHERAREADSATARRSTPGCQPRPARSARIRIPHADL